MKVTKNQLDVINEKLLIQDKIHDENIRLELVDHIASIIEEEGKSFDDSFSAFWNSHKKISLITNAKEQMLIKDAQIESFFWSTLFKPITMTLLFACSLISFFLSVKCNLFPEIFDAILLTLMALVLIGFLVIKFMKIKTFIYTKNLFNSISLYFVLVLQLFNSFLREGILTNPWLTFGFWILCYFYLISLFAFYRAHKFGIKLKSISSLIFFVSSLFLINPCAYFY